MPVPETPEVPASIDFNQIAQVIIPLIPTIIECFAKQTPARQMAIARLAKQKDAVDLLKAFAGDVKASSPES